MQLPLPPPAALPPAGGSATRRRSTAELVSLVLPRRCGGCEVGAPPPRRAGRHVLAGGDAAEALGALFCPQCRARLGSVAPRELAGTAGPKTWVSAGYEGPLRQALLRFKERGRLDLLPGLASALTASIGAARHEWAGPVVVVPVPAQRRSVVIRRGDPLGRLVAAASGATRGEVPVRRLLHHTRLVADSAGLSATERRDNLAMALVSAPAEGLCVVLADDIVTTGATLAEAARALLVAGAHEVRAAAVAATPHRSPARDGRSC